MATRLAVDTPGVETVAFLLVLAIAVAAVTLPWRRIPPAWVVAGGCLSLSWEFSVLPCLPLWWQSWTPAGSRHEQLLHGWWRRLGCLLSAWGCGRLRFVEGCGTGKSEELTLPASLHQSPQRDTPRLALFLHASAASMASRIVSTTCWPTGSSGTFTHSASSSTCALKITLLWFPPGRTTSLTL